MKTVSVLRHETKYEINYGDYVILSALLKSVCDLDPNSQSDDGYFVRSVYFDTPFSQDYYDKTIGHYQRKKIRLRTYDLEAETYKLELKYKEGHLLMKDSLSVSRDEGFALINGNHRIAALQTQEASRIRHFLQRDLYRPRIMIDYEREAYVHPFSNMRINFDKRIRSNMISFDIRDEHSNMQPINYDPVFVLEIKYNDFIPDWLKTILGQFSLTQTSFSKYCLSRLF